MTRNLKALGLCLAAVFVISWISASAAMAETEPVASFTAPEYPAKITGTQVEEHKFRIGSNFEMGCEKSHFHAELTAASTSLTVHPTYEGCRVRFGTETFPETITTHECYLTFTVHSGAADSWTGQAHVMCPNEGEKIEIHVYEAGDTTHTGPARCTYAIEPQTINTGISYENMTAEGTVTVSEEEAPTTVKKTSGTLAKCGAGTQTSKYTGKVTTTAINQAGEMINSSIVEGMP